MVIARQTSSLPSGNCMLFLLQNPLPLPLTVPFCSSLDSPAHSFFADKGASANMLLDQLPPATRKMFAVPSPKRQRTTGDGQDIATTGSRPASPSSQRHSSPKTTPTTWTREELQETTANSRPAPPRANPSNLMSRCHICYRKPMMKADLDSFADCEFCGNRTCYVCLRKCEGWGPPDENTNRMSGLATSDVRSADSFTMLDADASQVHGQQPKPRLENKQPPGHRRLGESREWAEKGHRQMICSRCCIEKGPEGDAMCFGCLQSLEG
jgi:hypothetical protein